MPLVQEMRHPRGLNFANERKVYHLREDQNMPWSKIAGKVENEAGEASTTETVRRAFKRFSVKKGRSSYKFSNCGRKPWKFTKPVENFLVRKLLAIRKNKICTSTTLQGLLAKEKGLLVADSAIRKVLIKRGYKWLPRRQKRLYSEKDKKARLKFARRVARMSIQQVREEMALSMDGVVLTIPPADPVDRLNFCRQGETHMWRTPGEYAIPDLAGADSYVAQAPMSRVVPMWGGVSGGGCAEVVFHKSRKLSSEEWLGLITSGKFTAALRSVRPAGKRPWKVLCDNEKFLHSKICQKALAARKIKLWFVPARSPDLNPVERFWSWLRKELRRRDLQDLHAKRPVLGKMAYRRRVRGVMKTKKAKLVATNIAKGFKKVCKKVVDKLGAHSGK